MSTQDSQGVYLNDFAKGTPGDVTDADANKKTETVRVETGEVSVGMAVCFGTDPTEVVLGGTEFAGIVQSDKSALFDTISPGQYLTVLQAGEITVRAATQVSSADPVTFDPATGAIGAGLPLTIAGASFSGPAQAGATTEVLLTREGIGVSGSGSALPTPTDGPASITFANGGDLFQSEFAVFDSGAQNGLAQADIPVTLTPSDSGAAIWARARSFEDGVTIVKDWTLCGTTSGTGEQTFTFPAVPLSTHWCFIDIAVGAGEVTSSNHYFNVGFVWAIWGQSNWALMLGNNSSLNTLRDPMTHPGDVLIGRRVAPYAGPDSTVLVPMDDVTAISPAIIDWCNAWSAAMPGYKLACAWHTVSGTGTVDTLTTEAERLAGTYNVAGDSRDFNVEYALHRALIRDGSQVGVIWVAGWIAANGGGGPLASDLMAPVYMAKDGTGAPIDARVPTVFRESGLPRMYCAIAQDGRDFGYYNPGVVNDGGLYDMRYTKIGWMGPHGRARTGMPSFDAVTSFGDLSGYFPAGSNDDFDYSEVVRTCLEVHSGSNPAFPEAIRWDGETVGGQREDGDEAHHASNSRDGRQRLARIGMFYALNQLDLINVQVPLLDQRYDELDGSAIYFGIAGRNITTERLWRTANGQPLSGYADGRDEPPAVIQPLPNLAVSHRTEVMGFAINNSPATDAAIYTVQGSDTNLLAQGFTAGQSVIRVTPNSGSFAVTDVVAYGVDRLPGYQVGGDATPTNGGDYGDVVGAYLNWPVVDMGQPVGILPRLPVLKQSLYRTLPTTRPLPPTFTIDGTTSWTSAVGVVDNDFQMAYEVKGFVTNLAQDRFIQLGSSTAAMLRLQATGALNYRDGGSSIAYNPDPPAVALTVPFHFRLIIDRNKLSDQLTLIDVLRDVTVTGAGATGTDFPNNALNFAPDGLTGTFERMVVWRGDNSVDWQPDWDNDTPNYGIVGNAGGLPTILGGLTQSGPNPT